MNTADAPGASETGRRLVVREFDVADTDSLIALWRACGLTRPWNDPQRDIERRRAIDDGLFLVGVGTDGGRGTGVAADTTDDGRPDGERGDGPSGASVLVASAMGGYDGHRGWVNYLAVHPDRRGLGHGRALMDELERRLLARGCPKINLQVRDGNDAALEFYARLGFTVDATTSLGKRLIPDD